MPHYECDQCGECCRGRLIVQADELDVLREPRLIEADRHYAGQTVEKVLVQLQEDFGRVITLSCGKPCPFLNKGNRCSIYPTRPNDCVAMQAGDEQCQQAREAAGLPRLNAMETG